MKVGPKGQILVDDYCISSVPSISAVGDVIDRIQVGLVCCPSSPEHFSAYQGGLCGRPHPGGLPAALAQCVWLRVKEISWGHPHPGGLPPPCGVRRSSAWCGVRWSGAWCGIPHKGGPPHQLRHRS